MRLKDVKGPGNDGIIQEFLKHNIRAYSYRYYTDACCLTVCPIDAGAIELAGHGLDVLAAGARGTTQIYKARTNLRHFAPEIYVIPVSIHYLVKLWCSKIDLISTLINTSCSLFVVRYELIDRITLSSDI